MNIFVHESSYNRSVGCRRFLVLYYKTDGTVVFQFRASIYFVSMDSMIQSESSILYSFPQKGQILFLYASKLAPH